ncbi:rano class II histocompatibility antigen, A beta chain-like [Chanos chanos]|uniref:Rano class II histocompatibility antigen, A beta chain-like n=1 Tax=Chanos chanos TaxID=29144 RepID=A0A6J2UMX0_CHACN|nr:rano class II histocompatibility antigen, A beta chain-like [Chanos chanos]
MVFSETRYFNKHRVMTFNSSWNKFVGHTDYGKAWAQQLNSDSHFMVWARLQVDIFCKFYASHYFSFVNKTVQPRVHLMLIKPASSSHPATLMCSAYDFYPKPIKLSWLSNGKDITSHVTSTEELSNDNWYYQAHSHLEYTPSSGERISCVVEHASFSQSMVYDWDSCIPDPEMKNKMVTGVAGLLLGTITAITGLVYYRKKSTGHILVPTQPIPRVIDVAFDGNGSCPSGLMPGDADS